MGDGQGELGKKTFPDGVPDRENIFKSGDNLPPELVSSFFFVLEWWKLIFVFIQFEIFGSKAEKNEYMFVH